MSKKVELSPDFIGIGTTNAATTWIFNCLREHPEISLPTLKEIHFFNKNYNYKKGIETYRKYYNHCLGNKITGEFTPEYIKSPLCALRIHKHFPNTKIIACLRNPVDKIYSEYRAHKKKKTRLSIYKNFEEAIMKDSTLIREAFYYKQLRHYYRLFQKQNILILIYEEIKKKPIEFLTKIYNFFALENKSFVPTLISKGVNVTGIRTYRHKIPVINRILYKLMLKIKVDDKVRNRLRKTLINDLLEKFLDFNWKRIHKTNTTERLIEKKQMNEETRNILERIFRPDIMKLEKLIEKDLSIWKY